MLGAEEALFQTGWFVESMITQVLVVFCIRTRRLVFRSRPGRLLVGMTAGAVGLAIVLPLLLVGRWFGFVPPPPQFFAYVLATTIAHLVVVEFARSRSIAASHMRRPRSSASHETSPGAETAGGTAPDIDHRLFACCGAWRQ